MLGELGHLQHWVLGFWSQSSFCNMLKLCLMLQTAAEAFARSKLPVALLPVALAQWCSGTRNASGFLSSSGNHVDQICSRLIAQTPPCSLPLPQTCWEPKSIRERQLQNRKHNFFPSEHLILPRSTWSGGPGEPLKGSSSRSLS